jgi:hypothetical protein
LNGSKRQIQNGRWAMDGAIRWSASFILRERKCGSDALSRAPIDSDLVWTWRGSEMFAQSWLTYDTPPIERNSGITAQGQCCAEMKKSLMTTENRWKF